MHPDFLKYIRALSKQDKKTLSQKALKTVEEVGELARVVLPFDNAYATNHRFVEREKILEEAMDTLLCAISVAYELDFTDEQIDEMLVRKAEKWAMLQSKEKDLKYPLPFEIHVTVSIDGHTPKEVDAELVAFKSSCTHIGVKPIVIDLQSKLGTSIMHDVMTSSKHFGTNTTALHEAKRIANLLTEAQFDVVRTKIETVPWHPAAPKFLSDKMPPNCYFESHVPVTLPNDEELQRFRDVCKNWKGVHVSQNVFKRLENGEFVVMATYRVYDGNNDKFKAEVDSLITMLQTHGGFKTGKAITEFAVYDTKISHDASWLLSS